MANEMILKNGLRTTALKVGNYNFPTSAGTLDQVLKIDGSGNLIFATNPAGGIQHVVDDTAPQLGGSLDVQSNIIFTNTSNGNITLSPNGTGSVDVSSKKIINLATPVDPTDAATMDYVDTQVATKIGAVVSDTSPTLGNDLNLNGHSLNAGIGSDVNFTLDEGQFVNIGTLKIMSPMDIAPTTVTPAVQYSYAITTQATIPSAYIDYTFKSSDGWKMGTLFVLSDGTNVSIVDMGTELGTPSIDFAASISGSNVNIVGTNMAATAPQNLRITIRYMS